jgi:tetratricopeptide (TPR) repeat protein
MYEQRGDLEKAFEYYKKGLDVKVKAKAPVMSVVFSLSNVANVSSTMKNYEDAHKLIDDALERLKAEKVPPREALACAYDTKGKTYDREGKLKEAEEMFQVAVDIRETIAENMPYVESLVHLADVNKRKGNYEKSLELAKCALKLTSKATLAMPQNPFIAECLECVADVYNRKGYVEKYRVTLEKIETELLRLEQVFLCQCNDRALEKIRNQIQDIKAKLDNLPKES